MADIRPTGLFDAPTQDDVLDLMNRQKQARIQQAMKAHAGGGYLASLAAKAQQQGIEALKQGLGGVAGAMGMPVREDPMLAKARKTDRDRKEMMELFKTRSMDNPEDFYQMANEMLKRGYSGEAAKLMEQGHGFRKQTQAETGLDIKQQEVSISKGHLGLAKAKEDFFQRQDIKRLSISEQNAKWAQQERVVQRAFKTRGLDIQASRNVDLRVIAEKDLKLRELFQDQNHSVAQQNANTNRFVAKTNQVYGLREQARKEKGQEATIRQADAALALKEQLDLRAADATDARVELEGDRNKLADFLGRGAHELEKAKHKYLKLSTDRLYQMALDKMTFEQSLAERGMTVKEALSEHSILLDDKKFDHTVLTDTAQRDLAQDNFEFKKEMAYKSDSREDKIFALKKKYDEFNMKLSLNKHNFTEEAFAIQEARLQKRMDMERYFKHEGIAQKDRHKEIDRVLETEGLILKGLSIKQRQDQFIKKLAQDKMLGLKGLDIQQQKVQLQDDIRKDDARLKQFGLDLEAMSIGDLKEYRLASLELKNKDIEMGVRIANINAKAKGFKPHKTFTAADMSVLDAQLKSGWFDKIKDSPHLKEKYGGDWWSAEDTSKEMIADSLSSLKTRFPNSNVEELLDMFVNPPAVGGGGGKSPPGFSVTPINKGG